MKTRVERAIAELKLAAGDRRFVLVMDKAHRDADLSSMRIEQGSMMTGWEVLGLLHHGLLSMEADYRRHRDEAGSA